MGGGGRATAGRLDGLVADLRSPGSEVIAVRCDVTVDPEVDRLIAAAVDATGRLDVLVSAAGIAPSEDEAIESPDLFRRVLAVNTTGT